MDAVELLGSGGPFVADTSAWWRAASLPSELGALLERALLGDRLWITPIVRMEILYSARTSSSTPRSSGSSTPYASCAMIAPSPTPR